MRRLLLLLLLFPGAIGATESEKLRRVTDEWRKARTQTRPIESYLRPLVASDPHFSSDPGLELDHMGAEMRRAYDGLHYLLNTSLKAQFVGLSSDSLRQEWLRRYWRLRDPTPTTPENERRREHERRVAKSRRDFAWKESPGWDARGGILITFGEPDSIISEAPDIREGVGFIPGWEDWLYLDEKWVAQFERPNPKGPWKFGRSSMPLSSRPDIVSREKYQLGYSPEDLDHADGRDRESDLIGLQEERRLLHQKDLANAHLSPEIVEHEIRNDLRARELLRKRDEAIWAFSKELEAGNDRFVLRGEPQRSIWYVFDVDVFKGPPGRMRVEVHYQFNIQDLTFSWKDSLYVARYRVEGTLLDRNVREAARDTWSEALQAKNFRSTLEGRLLPGQLMFEVPEGVYRLAIRFVDQYGAAEGTYLTDVEVPRYDGRELAVSDIEMATKIVYADESWHERFVKNDRLVIPNPIGVYRKSKQLTGYFEIYGLQLDDSGLCRYEVTYSIVPRSLGREEGWFPRSGLQRRPFVTASFTGEGGTRELVEELRVDIAALEEDSYDIVLTVHDLVADVEAIARSAFVVFE
ncbi:MAG: GWxTD domain-containing protein [Candidatus Latescibacterota bacterium]|nr:MAG: GWxTD domain-containing protein [Candidatus Latescibacterota bacterium]